MHELRSSNASLLCSLSSLFADSLHSFVGLRPFPHFLRARREYAKWNFLKILNVHSNKLSGVLPPEYASLTALRALFVDINHISGTLPPGYSALGQLTDMWAGANHISGTLPSSWSKLSSLQHLKMYGQRDEPMLCTTVGPRAVWVCCGMVWQTPVVLYSFFRVFFLFALHLFLTPLLSLPHRFPSFLFPTPHIPVKI